MSLDQTVALGLISEFSNKFFGLLEKGIESNQSLTISLASKDGVSPEFVEMMKHRTESGNAALVALGSSIKEAMASMTKQTSEMIPLVLANREKLEKMRYDHELELAKLKTAIPEVALADFKASIARSISEAYDEDTKSLMAAHLGVTLPSVAQKKKEAA